MCDYIIKISLQEHPFIITSFGGSKECDYKGDDCTAYIIYGAFE